MEEIVYHFEEHEIPVIMFAQEWIVGLFASLIPFESMTIFFDHFFSESWPFFYKLILTILNSSKKEILEEEELDEIL